nr:cytochrome P450 [Parafrankia sp. CH37]
MEKLRAGRSDPAVLTRAADEIVRWVSPVMGFRRTTTTDVVLGGQPIAAGEKVVMYYSSANYDESVFADPTVSTSAATRTRMWASVAAARTSASASTWRCERSS